jgi:hypothetical protein
MKSHFVFKKNCRQDQTLKLINTGHKLSYSGALLRIAVAKFFFKNVQNDIIATNLATLVAIGVCFIVIIERFQTKIDR